MYILLLIFWIVLGFQLHHTFVIVVSKCLGSLKVLIQKRSASHWDPCFLCKFFGILLYLQFSCQCHRLLSSFTVKSCEWWGFWLLEMAGINTFTETPSMEWFATQAVLRVSLGNFLFFVMFALIMIGVKDQQDYRDSWHHGGWMAKLIIWCITIILMFFVPNGVANAYGLKQIHPVHFMSVLF